MLQGLTFGPAATDQSQGRWGGEGSQTGGGEPRDLAYQLDT